jgi:hypothetical protein
MIINLFSRKIKICSLFDFENSFLKLYKIDNNNFDEIVYVKRYTGASKFDEIRKIVYVNKDDNPYQVLIYALRSFYALDYNQHLLLHASSIYINNKGAVLFVGPPGSGKTTILKNALNLGYHYISEDLIFIRDDICYLSPPFKVLEIKNYCEISEISEIYFINFRYGAKFVKVHLNEEEKKKLIFENLFNTKALSIQFETYKKLIKVPSYYVIYSDCNELISTFS